MSHVNSPKGYFCQSGRLYPCGCFSGGRPISPCRRGPYYQDQTGKTTCKLIPRGFRGPADSAPYATSNIISCVVSCACCKGVLIDHCTTAWLHLPERRWQTCLQDMPFMLHSVLLQPSLHHNPQQRLVSRHNVDEACSPVVQRLVQVLLGRAGHSQGLWWRSEQRMWQPTPEASVDSSGCHQWPCCSQEHWQLARSTLECVSCCGSWL